MLEAIMKNYTIIFLFFNVSFIACKIKTAEDFRAKHITETIFGKHGAQLSKDHKELICALVHDLLIASSFQIKDALYKTIALLSKEVHKRTVIIKSQQNAAIDHALFILTIQENHFRQAFLSYAHAVTYKEQIIGSVVHSLDRIISFFKSLITKQKTFIDQLADYLFAYAVIEREHILSDYQKTLYFFSAIKKTYFPEIIFFWEDHYAKGRLLKMIKDNHHMIKVQADLLLAAGKDAVEDAVDGVLEGGALSLMESEADKALVSVAEKEIAESALPTGILESVEGSMVTEATKTGESVASRTLLDMMKQEFNDGLEADLETTVIGNLKEAAAAEDGFEDNVEGSLVGNEASDAGENTAEEKLESEVATNEEGNEVKDVSGKDPETKINKKESSAERRSRWKSERAAEREKLKTDWKASKTDTKMGKIKKIKLGMRYGWMQLKSFTGAQALGDVMHDFVTGPLGEYYKTAIYERFIAPLEDNALKRGMDNLPGWMHMAADMTIQMGIMQAGGMVAFWTQQDLAEIYRKYAEMQKQLSGINSQVSSGLEQQLINLLKYSGKAFSANSSLLDELHGNVLSQAQYEAHYRQKALLKTKPKHYFVVAPEVTMSGTQEGPMSIDERFLQGVMFTPFYNDRALFSPSNWYNIFRIGNWQYMVDDDLFSQFKTVSLNQETPLLQGQQALYNSIFTDYVPLQSDSYTLVVDCTLEVISYPYVCGIMFNSARWISGVVDNYHKHRFCGFLGTTDKKNYAVLEESVITDGSSNPRVQWPAFMFFNAPNNYLQKPIVVSSLPIVYRFTIQTQKDTVTVTIENITNQTQAVKPSVITLTKKECDASLFLQHGIGFMSAGCSATFKIKEPTDLTYSTEQKNAFKALLLQ